LKITLLQENISHVVADGLVLPVDGQICAIGGTAAANALKASFVKETDSIDEQMELYSYIEADIARLRPIQHGHSVIMEGNETWRRLVIVAAFYHNVNDTIFSPQQSADLISLAIQNGVKESVKQHIKTITMTLMGTSYRVSSRESILAISKGLSAVKGEEIEVKWCILEEGDFRYAKKMNDFLEGLLFI
jgi:hypothetical protein